MVARRGHRVRHPSSYVVVKLSAPLVAAMKALRNTSGVKMTGYSSANGLYTSVLSGWAPFRVYR